MENLNATKCADLKILNAELTQMSDKDLYKKCQEFGSLSLQYRRKFCGLLPEVNRRRLFEKYGFRSIYEFGSKLAGLSNQAVDDVLRLDKKFEDKLVLRAKLQSGEIGYSKLRAVSAIATQETQKLWAQKAEQMSKGTLEMYVREMKKQREAEHLKDFVEGIREQEKFPGKSIPTMQSFSEQSSEPIIPHEEKQTFSCKMNPKLIARLKVYRKCLEKEEKKQVGWEDVFEKLLEEKQPKAQAERKSKALPQEVKTPKKYSNKNEESSLQRPQPISGHGPRPISRHIPAAIKREVEERSEGICEYPNCLKPAEHFHHAERFALTGRHTNIRTLCKAHHELAHRGLIAAEEKEPTEWKLQLFPDLVEPKFEVDRVVRKFLPFS